MTDEIKKLKNNSNRRKISGTIVKRSGDKTVSVRVSHVLVHPLYQKRSTRTKNYLVHDPKNEGQVGDTVTIEESRPISRRKRWALISIDK